MHVYFPSYDRFVLMNKERLHYYASLKCKSEKWTFEWHPNGRYIFKWTLHSYLHFNRKQCSNSESLILRMDLIPRDTTLYFSMKRRQYPIISTLVMIANKSQGQSINKVGYFFLDLFVLLFFLLLIFFVFHLNLPWLLNN